jgi:CRAL/TRIO domain
LRYLEAHQNKEAPARKATLESLQWREQFQIDTILSRPHVNYDVAKRILPHYLIGRSAVTNHVVFIQRPGLSDLQLAKHNHVVIQDMLLQYAFVFEYCWNVLHPHDTSDTDPDALMIGILDIQGINLSILRKPELINFVKEFVGMIDAHYPSRAYKTYMINAPHWFSALYKLVSPIMRETTKEKIVLYSAGPQQDAALVAALGEDVAATVNQALRIPDRKHHHHHQHHHNKKHKQHDLTLTSDILLETELEQEIRNFVSTVLVPTICLSGRMHCM